MLARKMGASSVEMRSQQKKIKFLTLRSYLLVLLVPIIVSVLFYFFSVRETQDYAVRLNNSVLHSASNSLDLRLQEVEHIAAEILDSTAVQLFQSNDTSFLYPYSYKLIETRDNLRDYTLTQLFIKDYFIAFNRSQVVMNSKIIYTYDDFFTNYYILPDVTGESIIKSLLNGDIATGLLPAQEITLLETTGQYLSLVNPLIGSKLGSDGYLMILIDEAEVVSLFSDINIGLFGAIYIVDSDGEILTSIAGEDTALDALFDATVDRALEGSDEETFYMSTQSGSMLVNTLHSNTSNLTYISVQPQSLILERVNFIRNMMLVCFSITLLAGGFLSLWQARRFYGPVTAVLNEIGVSPEDPNEAFESIRDMIARLRTNYAHLYELASEHKALLRSSFLSRLFNGSINVETEAIRVCQHIFPEQVSFTVARVLLIRITANETGATDIALLALLASFKVTLKDALDRRLSQPLYYDIDEETLALILFDLDKIQIDTLITFLFDELPEQIRESISISGGGEVTQLTKIVRSYEQANISLAMQQYSPKVSSQRVAWMDDIAGTVQYFYPMDMRHHLAEAVRRGDAEAVTQILDELFHVNFGERPMPESIHKVFISDLLGSAVQCIALLIAEETDQQSFTDRFEPIFRAPTQKQPTKLRALFLDLTEYSNRHQNETTHLLASEVIEYLRDHFHESDLSLTDIAEYFSVNAPFLSARFKQQTGKNLSQYLEDLRIQEAQRLIRTTNLTINSIAEEVGYLSTNTFCRAFRRNTGYNTSTYKTMSEN